MARRSRRGLTIALVACCWAVLPAAAALADDGHHGRDGHDRGRHAGRQGDPRRGRPGWDGSASADSSPGAQGWHHCQPDGAGSTADNGHAGGMAAGFVAGPAPVRRTVIRIQPAPAAQTLAAQAPAAPADQEQGSADQEQGSADQEQGSADQAQGSADQAQGPADQAQGPADQAQGPADQPAPRTGTTNPAGATNPADAADATPAPAGPSPGGPAVSVATPAADTAGPGLAGLLPLVAGGGLLALVGYGFAVRGRLGRLG